jgi:predicted DsbA family dithiol-disulfide isomerase
MTQIAITLYSDVLCIWAYFAQARVDAVRAAYGDRVVFAPRLCPVFGDTAHKMATQWGSKGGYDGFAAHLMQVAAGFPELPVNPAIWRSVRPTSSLSPHLLLKAVQVGCGADAFDRAATAMRHAFFVDARDIGVRAVQRDIAAAAGANLAAVMQALDDGRAHAALSADYKDAEAAGVTGSPTFVLGDGRQKLYGNIGFRILDANIQELLRAPNPDNASWC